MDTVCCDGMVVALEAYPGVAAAAADRLCAVWQQEEESCWHSEPEDADEDCSPLLRQLWAADQLLPITPPQQPAWCVQQQHRHQPPRRRRQRRQDCSSDAAKLLECQRWVCAQQGQPNQGDGQPAAEVAPQPGAGTGTVTLTTSVHGAGGSSSSLDSAGSPAGECAGDAVDDVSAQKAAAQARFAEQQRMQAAPSSKQQAAVRFSTALLQEEQARLLQPTYQTRMFVCVLLSNLLCCLMLLLAKGPLGRMVGSGSPVQWPLLLGVSGCLGWLFMARLKPLQFADPTLEQHFAVRSQPGRCLLDVWFSLAGCSGLLATVRSEASSASLARTAAAGAPPPEPLAALQLALLLSLLAVLVAAALLVLVAPKVYRRWREQLIFAGKVAMVSGLLAMQPSSGFPGVQLEQQPWLSFLRDSPQHAQAAGILLVMGTVQAFLLLALMVRVSAYLPMQLLHVTALLITFAGSGSSGFGMVVYAAQLLVFGLWAPTRVLTHLELSARRSFLARHLSQGCCAAGAGKLGKL